LIFQISVFFFKKKSILLIVLFVELQSPNLNPNLYSPCLAGCAELYLCWNSLAVDYKLLHIFTGLWFCIH
jgi:hypothetical protein